MESEESAQERAYRAYALNGPPMRVLLSVCTPLALYQALQQIFKVLDALLAAKISSDAVSAVSALTQITLMITALGTGLATGGCIKISEAYGRGDHPTVRRLVATLYALAAGIGVLVIAVLVPLAEPFLRLLSTPEPLILAGAGYFRVELLSLVVSFFNTVYIAIERARGHAKKILVLNLVIIGVKLGLSALFVLVMNGGVIMIAAATLIGQGVLTLYALFTMARDEGMFRFSARNIRMDRETVLPVVKLSYPVSAEKMLFAAGKVLVNSMSGLYGGLTVGALGISNNIGGLTTNWHSGMLDGACALISQNRGAGRYRRTLRLFWRLMLIDVAIGLAGILLVSRGLPWLAEVFARSRSEFDREFCDMIVSIHRWELLGYVTLGVNSACLALLLGYGCTKRTLLLNLARVFLFRVPVLWALQRFTDMGVEAVGVAMMVSNILAGVSAFLATLPVIRRIRTLAGQEGPEEPQTMAGQGPL